MGKLLHRGTGVLLVTSGVDHFDREVYCIANHFNKDYKNEEFCLHNTCMGGGITCSLIIEFKDTHTHTPETVCFSVLRV